MMLQTKEKLRVAQDDRAIADLSQETTVQAVLVSNTMIWNRNLLLLLRRLMRTSD